MRKKNESETGNGVVSKSYRTVDSFDFLREMTAVETQKALQLLGLPAAPQADLYTTVKTLESSLSFTNLQAEYVKSELRYES